MKKTVFSLTLALSAITAGAQESQTAYNFLRLPVSAHAAALGGDNITIIEDDPSLMFANPALLSSVSDKSINLNFMTYMAGATTASASYNRIIKDKATVAVTAQYMDYGKMKQTDESGVQTGEFSAKDIAISGVFSYLLSERLSGGITAKVINSYIGDYSSWAVGVDLGLNYYDPDREWSLSLVAKNLGGQLKAYDDEYDKMPLDVQLGASKRFATLPFRLSATLVDLTHWDYSVINHLVAGVDIILSQQIYVAAGYSFRRADEMKIQSGADEESSHWVLVRSRPPARTLQATACIRKISRIIKFTDGKRNLQLIINMKKITIAIDGLSSCGKSTMAKDLARTIGYTYIDTGAMYRAVTLYALRNGLFNADGSIKADELRACMGDIDISFKFNHSTGRPDTYLNGELVEGDIRTMEVSAHVSPIATLPFVRHALVASQQAMGRGGGVVMDGRDIGTTVFPHAELKVFVTASAEVRAKRRYDELCAKGMEADYADILKNVEERDYIDSHREVSPLRKADDALELDNSYMTIEQQKEWLMQKYEEAARD